MSLCSKLVPALANSSLTFCRYRSIALSWYQGAANIADSVKHQARREPQRVALENIFAGPYIFITPFCMSWDRDAECIEREETWGGVSAPLTIRLGVRRSVVSSPSGVRGGAPAENGFYASWNTIFSIFERLRAPQTSRSPGKLSSLSPPSWRAWRQVRKRIPIDLRLTEAFRLLAYSLCIIVMYISARAHFTMKDKKLSYCWETVRRESMARIAEVDVEMTT